ncbi:class 1 fructose-bisphosphatase [Algirhabdus cladophorae]|uniref:class 1 fructose-bisphosphatase n=1 Tax=Algirhabdus cladophorae TaxID=3377108 RepID=UPI003B845D6F
MTMNRTTLNAYLEQEVSDPDLVDLIDRIASACWKISQVVRDAALNGHQGQAQSINPQGEVQKPIDLLADDIFRHSCKQNDRTSVLISEEVEEITQLRPSQQGDFVVAYDPLDGSSNLDVDLSVGSVFGVSRLAKDLKPLPAGRALICSGYAIYGPSTMLVLTLGTRVVGFTLDMGSEDYVLTHPDMRIPADTAEFAINMSCAPHWDARAARYVEQCVAGPDGARGKAFNMRWTASMVADIHRILIRGGVFLYPMDAENAGLGGKLRLLYEAFPMAMIAEVAGGSASNGKADILDVSAETPHQRTSVILGAQNEVQHFQSLTL